MDNSILLGFLALIFAYGRPAQAQQKERTGMVPLDTTAYIVQDSVMIRTEYGGLLSAVVVRNKHISAPQPAALMFSIYANLSRSLSEAKYAADHGYVGIVADARGKRLSPDQIVPYVDEHRDVNSVIDWISRQPWSNGKVGMYGGSYAGFAQWAGAKHLHPALKTIVPYVAAIPGLGLPMENNIFLNANYQWAFYVTTNKYTNESLNNARERWRTMRNKWFSSGAAYNQIDSIDGTPNPWLQKWLRHPDYDQYWQEMVPYQQDFAKINIPVLTVTGYYDDGQISALHYLREHYKYNPTADHYLIIGPYDHFGAQVGGRSVVNGYRVDSVALINVREITFGWLDYVLKGGQKPALLKDKINYEVMGANIWKHAPSLDKMSNSVARLYFSSHQHAGQYKLTTIRQKVKKLIHQHVDLADRKVYHNDYYPNPIVRETLDHTNGLFFLSKPFKNRMSVNGSFSGELKATINKKDMDVGLILYEVTPDGRFFELSYYIGRASYAADMSKRVLLHPGKQETIKFCRSRMVSRQLQKGSRLLVVLNINKNPFAQVNYGTGNDVATETLADAAVPLEIDWSTDSFVDIPLSWSGT